MPRKKEKCQGCARDIGMKNPPECYICGDKYCSMKCAEKRGLCIEYKKRDNGFVLICWECDDENDDSDVTIESDSDHDW